MSDRVRGGRQARDVLHEHNNGPYGQRAALAEAVEEDLRRSLVRHAVCSCRSDTHGRHRLSDGVRHDVFNVSAHAECEGNVDS